MNFCPFHVTRPGGRTDGWGWGDESGGGEGAGGRRTGAGGGGDAYGMECEFKKKKPGGKAGTENRLHDRWP